MKTKVWAKTEMTKISGTTVILNGFTESKEYVSSLGMIYKISHGVYETIVD